MKNWFRNLLGRTPVDPETLRGQQSDWIKQKFVEWQAAWHDAFDKDAALRAAGEFERPDPLPGEVQTDYRLIFGIARAQPETRQACFALFPNGAEMLRRFESYLAGPSTSLTEGAARDLVAEIARHIDKADPNEQVDWSKIEIVDTNAPHAQEVLARTEAISILFERNLLNPVPEKELPAIAAQLFLTEPVYSSAGNCYELRDWVTAAMFDARRDKIYELTYRLWHAGWRLHLAENGVVLACNRTD